MSALLRLPPNKYLILFLFGAYALWTVVSIPLFPIYARMVALGAKEVFHSLRPTVQSLSFSAVYPTLVWNFSPAVEAPLATHSTSFRLLAHNLILFLTLLTAIKVTPFRYRLLLVGLGGMLLCCLHIVDLVVALEHSYLSASGPPPAALSPSFIEWISIRFYRSLSVLALKQAMPFLILLVLVRRVDSGTSST